MKKTRSPVCSHVPTFLVVLALVGGNGLVGCNHSDSQSRANTANTQKQPGASTKEQSSAADGKAASARTPTDAQSSAGGQDSADGGPRCSVPLGAEPPPAAPADDCPASPNEIRTLPMGSLRFVDTQKAPVLRVERAETNAERSTGLMYRTQMDEDAGMLFTWPDERIRSFWMRNTCLPLDMLFIDAHGFIVGILEQVPTLNTLSRSVPCPAQRVLEVNAGFVRRHGVTPGQRIVVDF